VQSAKASSSELVTPVLSAFSTEFSTEVLKTSGRKMLTTEMQKKTAQSLGGSHALHFVEDYPATSSSNF
jgi:hypothetical protein